MLQGTGSGVGKSLLVAGLARACLRRGLSVRPFKPQNMSNNAAVTADGGEIGRAQALQARAAGVAPSTDMNPVLLKPQAGHGAQIVVQGRVVGSAGPREFQSRKAGLLPAVLDSFARLRAGADLVLVEGAGSASEVNLRRYDIANMGFAEAADMPVVLVGDIDRGGVIASLVGTLAVLADADAARIKGFIVNRMRGDPTLFADGMRFVAERTLWAPLGLVPFFPGCAFLPEEDAPEVAQGAAACGAVRVAVPILPRVANLDDLDPLAAEPGVRLLPVRPGAALPVAELVILPGSKATLADLAAFRDAGWDIDLAAHVRRGGRVLGLCGGYQMLGRSLADPAGVEGLPGTAPGLGLLDVATVLGGDKTLRETTGHSLADGAPLRGYEMHLGRTEGPDRARPFAALDAGPDGATSADGRVCGTYLHGLFADDAQRGAWLARLGAPASERDHEAEVEATLDAWAAHLEAHIDVDRLLALAR